MDKNRARSRSKSSLHNNPRLFSEKEKERERERQGGNEKHFFGGCLSIGLPGSVDTLIPSSWHVPAAELKSPNLWISRNMAAPRPPVINEWHAFDWAWLVKRDSPPSYIPWSEQIYLELSWNAASKVIFVACPSTIVRHIRFLRFSTTRWKSDSRYYGFFNAPHPPPSLLSGFDSFRFTRVASRIF